MKYRIVSNGTVFKIQKKGIFWGWNDYGEWTGYDDWWVPTYTAFAHAKAKLDWLLEQEEREAAPWRVVG